MLTRLSPLLCLISPFCEACCWKCCLYLLRAYFILCVYRLFQISSTLHMHNLYRSMALSLIHLQCKMCFMYSVVVSICFLSWGILQICMTLNCYQNECLSTFYIFHPLHFFYVLVWKGPNCSIRIAVIFFKFLVLIFSYYVLFKISELSNVPSNRFCIVWVTFWLYSLLKKTA